MQRLARRTRRRRRHRRPVRSPREHDRGIDERHGRADRHPLRHGDDPVGVRARDDVREARGAPDCVPERRRAVVVECRERARRQTDEEVRDRRGYDPAQGVGARSSRATSEPSPVRTPRERIRGEQRDERRAARRRAASAVAKPAAVACQPPASSRARASDGRTATRIACDGSDDRRRRRRTRRRTRPSRRSARTRVR